MKVKTWKSFDEYKEHYEDIEHDVNTYDYIHEHGRHCIDGECFARSEKEAHAKLVKAAAKVGLDIGYDDDIHNDLSKEGDEVMKIEIERIDDTHYYTCYLVSDFWA